MRIVFDTQSKAWATIKRWSIGILIIFIIFTIAEVLKHYAGWDTELAEGYFYGVHVARYKWRAA